MMNTDRQNNNRPSGQQDQSQSSGKKSGSSESQSSAAGDNQAHDENKASSPGMDPGIQQSAENARNASEEADLEQQRKETLTERD